MQKATFAAGCFWGVEKQFSRVQGVVSTKVGYTGGHTVNPTYDQVCGGNTGHAESIEIEFDPNVIQYTDLLNEFWNMHNPTTLNRQGPDVGTQYRSAIFYHDEEQHQHALNSKLEFAQTGKYTSPITTEISPAMEFYPAEEYHQKYLDKNGVDYC